MPPALTKVGDELEIDLSNCRGSEFQDALDKIRDRDQFPTRRFDFDRKLWLVPAEPDVAERLVKGVGCTAEKSLMDWIVTASREKAEELATRLPDDVPQALNIRWGHTRAPWQPKSVNGDKVTGLLPFQRVAVDHMVRHTRVLLGDEMGLGKTLIALSAVEEYRLRNGHVDGPKLIVAPSSVKGGWRREIERWLEPGTPLIVVDAGTPARRTKQIEEGVENNAYTICNWEQLRVKKEKQTRQVRRKDGSVSPRTETILVPKEPLFGATDWLAVIADEVHRAKNHESQQSRGLRLLDGVLKFGLTGTAVQNSPDELWAILAWLFPDDYHERGKRHAPGAMAYWPFYMTFCDHYELANKRKVVVGVKNSDQLRFRLKDRMVRRTAKILGLKGRKRIYYPVDLNPGQRKLYDEATNSMWLEVQKDAAEGDKSAQRFIETILAGGNVYTIPNGAARMVRQKQILESPALLGGDDDSAILDDLVEKIVDSRPDQWTVFVEFKGTADLIRQRLEKEKLEVGLYTGDVKPNDRTALEDAFQNGDIDVMVGTIGAMREGITLTAGHQQYWVSRPVVPAWAEQGEARNDRKGQQERVMVYIPQGKDTIADGSIQIINDRKEKIVKNIQPMDQIPKEQL